MDLNRKYSDHQIALLLAENAGNDRERYDLLAEASTIAGQISLYQHGLGAAAACAWSIAQMAGEDPR